MDCVGSPPLSHNMVKVFCVLIDFLESFSLSCSAPFEMDLSRESCKFVVEASELSVVFQGEGRVILFKLKCLELNLSINQGLINVPKSKWSISILSMIRVVEGNK